MPRYTTLHNIAPHYTTLHHSHTTPFHTTPHHTTSHHSTSHHTILHYTTLHHTRHVTHARTYVISASHHFIFHHIVLHRVTPNYTTSHIMSYNFASIALHYQKNTPRHTTTYPKTSHYIIWHMSRHITPHHITSNNILRPTILNDVLEMQFVKRPIQQPGLPTTVLP